MISIGVLVFIVLWCSVCASGQLVLTEQEQLTSSLRGSSGPERNLRPQHDCTLVRVDTQYDQSIVGAKNAIDASIELEPDVIRCELSEEDVKTLGQHFVTVKGLDEAQSSYIRSGETTLNTAATLSEDGALYLPAGAGLELFGTVPENRRRLAVTTGKKTVLVVRVIANDVSTTADRTQLADDIFGTFGDSVNLRSQYLQCSNNQLSFEPAPSDNNIKNGVVTVKVDMKAVGADRFNMENVVQGAAEEKVGSLKQFDHVILCLPKGSLSGGKYWVAYAYANYWLSVFNDSWCQRLSTLVHEVGHNLNLAHSGKKSDPYGDRSGMMGYSYDEDDTPKMCFNPAKSWQLGWYEPNTIDIYPFKGSWTGSVIGVADFSKASSNHYVVLKIVTGTSSNLFVGYNRMKGMNSGVKAEGNNVTIVSQGEGYSASDMKTGLSPGSFATFYNFANTKMNLVVKFVSQSTDSNGVDIATVSVYVTYPTRAPTRRPTRSPTRRPTGRPTSQPTRQPTRKPTSSPMFVI